MKKAVSLNLFIDNDWDKQKTVDEIYSIQVSGSGEILSSYFNLATLWGDQNDFSIIEQKMDKDFYSYLSDKLPLAKELIFSDLLNNANIESLEVVAVSSIEEKLAEKLNLKLAYSEDFFIELNRKDYLVSLSKILEVNFPKSNIFKLFELDIENLATPVVLKILTSAGGRGVFIIKKNNMEMVEYIKRQVLEVDDQLDILVQEYIPVAKHFYTVAHTDNLKSEVMGYEIEYDKSNNSKLHRKEKIISPVRQEVAMRLADELKNKGYSGYFGFDGFSDEDQKEYPVIDLNVRLDKSRIISRIAEKLNINMFYHEFRRERYSSFKKSCFREYWVDRLDELHKVSEKYLNQFEIIPILFSNFFSDKNEEGTVEISFFTVVKSSRDDQYHAWLDEIYNWLGIKK